MKGKKLRREERKRRIYVHARTQIKTQTRPDVAPFQRIVFVAGTDEGELAACALGSGTNDFVLITHQHERLLTVGKVDRLTCSILVCSCSWGVCARVQVCMFWCRNKRLIAALRLAAMLLDLTAVSE